jgi:hypothetical protein
MANRFVVYLLVRYTLKIWSTQEKKNFLSPQNWLFMYVSVLADCFLFRRHSHVTYFVNLKNGA